MRLRPASFAMLHVNRVCWAEHNVRLMLGTAQMSLDEQAWVGWDVRIQGYQLPAFIRRWRSASAGLVLG